MINAFSEIISYQEEEWEDFFIKRCLIDIFKDLIPLFKDKKTLSKAIRYIVWVYSKESDCVILGMDWEKNKKAIFDKAQLTNEYYEDLVLLNNRIVLETVQAWVKFQDSPTFSQLAMLKDLQQEMRISANSKILKSSGETDFDQKFKNAEYVKDLGKMIDDLEQELIQNSPKLKEAAREITRATKTKHTIGVEAFAN